MPDPLSRLAYVDDSGHQATGLVVYGWVHFSPGAWSRVLRTWIDVRRRLWREFGVSVDRELHSTHYINGRGRISTRPPRRHVHEGVVYWRDLGQDIAVTLLREVSSLEGVTAGAVYRRCEPHPRQGSKIRVYRELIELWECELAERREYGLVLVDGDGSDGSYRAAHRRLQLDRRRTIEDAIMVDSAQSQLVQLADLVAWCAYVSVERHPSHEYAWEWYERYLSARDPHRGPREV
ncbi:DUF3800 domain-containing protein [Aeromicrobium piscarium]|uniref:DUF3800 domain-containing protein n=1 Tax=Aeromicrobium piscarium TaxID=2590901 RepID=A0A554S8D2_9ACTN|nr:DUF3800 domain-containing protein [Aeromicrobium piscarium]TSD62582.1 DUF3800 domain-containing protein [Aeromicrobium piscarium]